MTTLSRASSIRCTGPIGMQPWVNPVATEIPGRQHQPGDPVARRRPSPGRGSARKKRARAAMRYEAADEKGAARRRGVDRRLRQVGTARIGMDERQGRLGRLDPAGVLARQIRARIVGRRKDPETVRRQRGGHHDSRRLVEDLVARPSKPRARPRRPRSESRCARPARGRAAAAPARPARSYRGSRGWLPRSAGSRATHCAARLAGSPAATAAANCALMTRRR